MFQLVDTQSQNAVIKVIGVGGGGGNAVNHMVEKDITGVEFINANTDVQDLKRSNCKIIMQLGANITKGLGAGANPEIGKQAAQEDREHIKEVLEGADMLFITAGMGGGTGTGAAPIVAQVAKQMGILTVAVVTKPFPFEGPRRMKVAMEGIDELAKNVDSLITIPNEKLLAVLGKEMSLLNAFSVANDVLYNATQGIAELITRQGLINVDFADVKTVMASMGMAMMGIGTASGENRAREAAEKAINSPLLEDINLAGAKGVLVNITAGLNLSIGEFDEVGNTVRQFADDDATVVVGTVIDPAMETEMRVTVVATGLGQSKSRGMGVRKHPVAVSTQPAEEPPMRLVANERHDRSESPGMPSSVSDYAGLDTPPSLRRGRLRQGQANDRAEKPMDYLDIPAFLRRQSD